MIPIPGFSRYTVERVGGIVRNGGGMKLADRVNKKTGYRQLTLISDEGRIRTIQVHILVLLAYKGQRPEPGWHGAHEDGNRLNCDESNLFWKPPKKNGEDRVRHGTNLPGEKNKQACMTNKQVRVTAWIGVLGTVPASWLADRFTSAGHKVTDEAILRMWRKQSWSSITNGIPKAERLCPQRGQRNGFNDQPAGVAQDGGEEARDLRS